MKMTCFFGFLMFRLGDEPLLKEGEMSWTLELARPRRTAQRRSATRSPIASYPDQSGPSEPKPSCARVSLSRTAITEYRRGEELDFDLTWLLPETLAASCGSRMASGNLAYWTL
jgi:hypothetical protein